MTLIHQSLAHLEEPHKQQTLASGRQPPHHRLVKSFVCSDLPDFHPVIVRKHWLIQWGDIVMQLPKLTSIDTVVNRLSLPSEDSLLDPTDNHLTDQADSEDNSLDTSLPELPIEIVPVHEPSHCS